MGWVNAINSDDSMIKSQLIPFTSEYSQLNHRHIKALPTQLRGMYSFARQSGIDLFW